MKHAALFLLVLFAASGCSRSTPAPKQKPAEDAKTGGDTKSALQTAVGGTDGVTMSGIKLFLYDKGPAVEGVARKPVLRIEADTFTSTGEKQWTFEKAHAFMVSRKTHEEWQLESAAGTLKEDENAFLSGGVIARLGAMTVNLEDISFETPADGESKAAWSDKPATVQDPAMDLHCEKVKLFPDDKLFQLTDVAGTFRFTQETPAP